MSDVRRSWPNANPFAGVVIGRSQNQKSSGDIDDSDQRVDTENMMDSDPTERATAWSATESKTGVSTWLARIRDWVEHVADGYDVDEEDEDEVL